MTTPLTAIPAAYVAATNCDDPAAFIAHLAGDAVVDDAGRMFQGREAIEGWSRHDIFGADVTLEVTAVDEREGDVLLTTIVDGTFDRTGLPDPVVIEHRLRTQGDKIVRLTCRLAGTA